MNEKPIIRTNNRHISGQANVKKMLERDPEWFSKMGRKGGLASYTGSKGFAANRELASRAGKIGGHKSRKSGPNKKTA